MAERGSKQQPLLHRLLLLPCAFRRLVLNACKMASQENLFTSEDEAFLQEMLEGDDLEDKAIAAVVHAILSRDDEEANWGGSRPGKAPNKDREFEVAYERLVKDYFSGEASKYDENDFERRFRVNETVFNRLRNAVEGKGLFQQRQDCTGKSGIHPLCCITAILWVLGNGDPFDCEDEYLQISETSVGDSAS